MIFKTTLYRIPSVTFKIEQQYFDMGEWRHKICRIALRKGFLVGVGGCVWWGGPIFHKMEPREKTMPRYVYRCSRAKLHPP